jgi:hypothetical protein
MRSLRVCCYIHSTAQEKYERKGQNGGHRDLSTFATGKQHFQQTSNQQGEFGDEPSPLRHGTHSGILEPRKPSTGFHYSPKKYHCNQAAAEPTLSS